MKIDLNDKVYAVELILDKDVLSKIGYTTHEMRTRIASFRPIGNININIDSDNVRVKSSTTPLAKSIERYAKEIAIRRGYPKTNNRNLGNGWTEWFGTPDYPVTQEMIWSCIMSAIWEIKKSIERGNKNDT